jgi:hypothetical protein
MDLSTLALTKSRGLRKEPPVLFAARSGTKRMLQPKEVEDVGTWRPLATLGLATMLVVSALPAYAGDATLLDAAYAGNVTAARRLLDAGANVNEADENGYTPLHWAAFEGNAALVKLLLAHGAHPNPADRHGATPLILAAGHGHAAAVAALLASGGKPDVRAHDGSSAEDLAMAERYLDVLVVLRRARPAPAVAEAPAEAAAPNQPAARAFKIVQGDQPLDDEAFLLAINPVDPSLGQRADLFGPARAARTVGVIGGDLGWVGLGVTAASFIVQQALAGNGPGSDAALWAGYGRTGGLALLGAGVGTWALGWTTAWLLAPHERPFTDAEAQAAADRYNGERPDGPAIRVVPQPQP